MNSEKTFTWQGEVRDNEVDLQGIVNNSNYFIYMAHTRHKFIKLLGIDFAKFSAEGFNLVLIHTDISFKDSLKSGDEFIVTCALEPKGKIRLIFNQEVIRKSDNKVITVAANTATCLNTKTGRPEFPPELKAALGMS